MNNNLSLIGYRMPAEWELQESVWIAWPYNKSDWPGLFKNIPKIVTQIISELSRSQKINLLINNYNDKKKIINLLSKFPNNLQNIIFYKITTNRIWLRDSGPIYIINEKTKKKVDCKF
jgi:agmatine deiminase